MTYDQLNVGDCIINDEVIMFIIGKAPSRCKVAKFDENRLDFIVFVICKDSNMDRPYMNAINKWGTMSKIAPCILQGEVYAPGRV